MKKLLVVYNTCGISGRSNLNAYLKSVESILEQDLEDTEVAISSCLNQPAEMSFLQSYFSDNVSYNYIKEILPVSITFNHTVNHCVEKFGEFEGYMFVDSGISFGEDTTIIRRLYDLFSSSEYGMVAARTDDDMGFDDWFKTDMVGDSLFSEDHLVVPVGRAVNLHTQIFSNKLLKSYGNILPDIFAGQCMESVFGFLCAALKTRWVVHKDIILEHATGMDGPSSGFSPSLHQLQGKPRWDHMFGTEESILDIIRRGTPYGMGYEENKSIAVHDPSKFTDDLSNDDKLKDYIKDNMFLKFPQFDYNNINHEFN